MTILKVTVTTTVQTENIKRLLHIIITKIIIKIMDMEEQNVGNVVLLVTYRNIVEVLDTKKGILLLMIVKE